MEMKLETDDMVNRPVTDVEFPVHSSEDYQALRRHWAAMPRIPKLVEPGECPVILRNSGQEIRSLLRGEESAGSLMAALVTLAAGDAGAANHHQPLEDELWFSLQGEWEWTIGSVTRRVGPGAFAYAPRNTCHAFRNIGDTPAMMFTINTPAGHERGFQAAGKLLAEKAPMAEVQKAFEDHDFIFHQPL
jgi:mannose-6-phosphate isomerase-like protein (cupin superfamily)